MKLITVLMVPVMVLAGAAVTNASQSQLASEADVLSLEAALQNLESTLEVADERGQSIPDEIRQRIETIHEEAIYLRVKMRKHRDSNGDGTGITIDEVRELERKIGLAQTDLRRLEGEGHRDQVSLASGTELTARLLDSLSTKTSQVGDRFEASVIEPVMAFGELAIPAGAVLKGVVEVSDPAEGRADRKARMVLAFEQLQIQGDTYDIEATVIDAGGDLETGIGDEKEKVGIGAGIGTILGAVLGGTKGAVVGAVLGGAGAILATEGKNVELPRGTVLKLRLDRDLELRVRDSVPIS